MKLPRHPYDPMALADFFDDGLSLLGAACERTWHNRLAVLAEGAAARPWNEDGPPVDTEILFHPPEGGVIADASREAFPGCPLTFRLAEELCPPVTVLERVALQPFDPRDRPPDPAVIERLWHASRPPCTRWQIRTGPLRTWHVSLLALVRCEIQAIDQHWSLHRLVLSLPDGSPDTGLAQSLDMASVDANPVDVPWPNLDPRTAASLLQAALRAELAPDLQQILKRQSRFLRHELRRIDDYFAGYQRELADRTRRARDETARDRMKERAAATAGERLRRREDQVGRHAIRVLPRVDSLCLLAEPAWRYTVAYHQPGADIETDAVFNPRSRTWATVLAPETPSRRE